MPRTLVVAAALLMAATARAQQPLPELRTEATNGGSIFHIRNISTQPLTGYLIELVNYPGSYYALWQDEFAPPIPPGGEKQIQVTNMTVGAVPDYVKLQAAIFADGSSAGAAERVKQFVERRRHVLQTVGQLIARIEKSGAGAKAELLEWANTIPQPTRRDRTSQEAVNNVAARTLIADTAKHLESTPPAEVLATLRASERELAASKPVL